MAGTGLDSVVTIRYYYNPAAQLIATRSYNYGTYENDSSYNSVLSPLGLPLTSTGYRFDGTNWNPIDRVLRTYTTTGMLSSETFQQYTLTVQCLDGKNSQSFIVAH